MQSISKRTAKETPKIYENMSEAGVFLINKINKDQNILPQSTKER